MGPLGMKSDLLGYNSISWGNNIIQLTVLKMTSSDKNETVAEYDEGLDLPSLMP